VIYDDRLVVYWIPLTIFGYGLTNMDAITQTGLTDFHTAFFNARTIMRKYRIPAFDCVYYYLIVHEGVYEAWLERFTNDLYVFGFETPNRQIYQGLHFRKYHLLGS